MICKKCNNEIPEDSKFCIKCGEKINTDSENTKVVDSASQDYKKVAIAIVALVIVFILGSFAWKNNADKRAEKELINNLGVDNEEDIQEIRKLYEEAHKEDEVELGEPIDEISDLADEECPIDNKKPLSGIILMEDKTDRVDNNLVHTINVYNVNPETGETDFVRKFSGLETPYGGTIDIFADGLFWQKGCIYQSRFNQDFTKISTTKGQDDGSTHVGWIDQEGAFTDVTEMILGETNDFEKVVPRHVAPLFTRDGKYFYYTDENENKLFRVLVDNISPNSVEELLTNITRDYYLDVDGTPKVNNSGDEIRLGPDGTAWGAYDGAVDWIDGTHVLNVFNEGMIYSLEAVIKEEMYAYPVRNINEIELIPNVDSRKNTNPVLSPDRTKMAFQSVDTHSSERLTEIYITTTDGNGTPQKLELDREFDSFTLIDWISENDNNGLNEEIMTSGRFGDTPSIVQISDDELCQRVRNHYEKTFGKTPSEVSVYSKSHKGYNVNIIDDSIIIDSYFVKPDLTGETDRNDMSFDLR